MHAQETHLKKENEELKALVATYQIQLKQYQEAHEQMRHQLNELIRHRFGAKSERTVDSNSPQMDLFATDLDMTANTATTAEEEAVTVPEHKRRKFKSKNTDNIPRDTIVIPVAEWHDG